MQKRQFMLILGFFMLPLAGFSQTPAKEKLDSDGKTAVVTISATNMYAGTTSPEAQNFFSQAQEYERKNDLENAKKYYLKAIEEDELYVEAYDNIGLVYRRLGDFDKAESYYLQSIKMYPEGLMAHQNLAVVYSLKQEYPKALKSYENVIAINPEDPEGYFGKANTYLQMGEFEKALQNGKKALDIYQSTNAPHLADGYYLVGLIYYYKNEKDQAITFLQEAKNLGVTLHPQIEQDLFPAPKAQEKDFILETPEDYAKYEEDMIKLINWLENTPLTEAPEQRKAVNAFVIQWITGTPAFSIEIKQEIIPYVDCADCLLIFMGGWTKYALESKDYENKFQGNLAGTESVISFYQSNKKAIGKNKEIEKLAKLKEKGQLEAFIRSNM